MNDTTSVGWLERLVSFGPQRCELTLEQPTWVGSGSAQNSQPSKKFSPFQSCTSLYGPALVASGIAAEAEEVPPELDDALVFETDGEALLPPLDAIVVP